MIRVQRIADGVSGYASQYLPASTVEMALITVISTTVNSASPSPAISVEHGSWIIKLDDGTWDAQAPITLWSVYEQSS